MVVVAAANAWFRGAFDLAAILLGPAMSFTLSSATECLLVLGVEHEHALLGHSVSESILLRAGFNIGRLGLSGRVELRSNSSSRALLNERLSNIWAVGREYRLLELPKGDDDPGSAIVTCR